MNINPMNTYNAVKPVEVAPQRGGGDVVVPTKPKVMATDTVTISAEAQDLNRGGGDVIVPPRPK